MTLAFFTSPFLTLALAYNFPVCSQSVSPSVSGFFNWSYELSRWFAFRMLAQIELPLSFPLISHRSSHCIALQNYEATWWCMQNFLNSQKLSAREFYDSFPTTSQYLNWGTEIFWKSCSFPDSSHFPSFKKFFSLLFYLL